jgi:4-amino-4-deoxy-L-arabinose transferase-like glycosyltransferase
MDTLVLMTSGYTGFLSLSALFLGLSGKLQPQLLTCFFFFTTMFYLICCVLLVRSRKEEFKALLPFAHLRMPLFFFFAIAGAASLLSPPIFDELSYHLSLPFRFLAEGSISSIPYNFYSNFPLNQEMLYIFGELFKGIYAARFINLFMGIGCALALIAIARRHFDYEGGLTGNLIFFSMLCVGTLLPFAYNEFGMTFYCLVSLLCFFNWIEEEKPIWLATAGALSGLALGAKYLAGIHFVALLLLIIAVDMVKKTDRKQRIANLFLFSFPALILFSPWLIKNWISTGNPAYPFLYSVFGGLDWNAFNNMRYFTTLKNHYGPSGIGLLRFLNLPAHLLFNFQNDVPLGLVVILTLPGWFYLRRANLKTKLLAGYILSSFLIWCSTSMVNRFLLPALAAYALLSGILLLTLKDRRVVLLLQGLIVLLLLITTYLNTYINRGDNYSLKEYYSLLAMSRAVNPLVSDTSKVLFVGEVRTYGFNQHVIAPSLFDANICEVLIKSNSTHAGLADAFRTINIRYLLFNPYRYQWQQSNFLYFRDEKNMRILNDFLNSPYCLPLFRSNDLRLYLIDRQPIRARDRSMNKLMLKPSLKLNGS